VTEPGFRKNYFRIDPKDYGCPVDSNDYDYTWEWFITMRELYSRAAEAHRYVLFAASQ